MLRISAKKLLEYDTKELHEKLFGDMVLIFEDGEVITNERATLFSHYVWKMHQKYPYTPLLKAHHLQTLIGDGETPHGAHLKLINSVLWSVYDAYASITPDRKQLLDDLAKLGYEITNEIYNELSIRLEAWTTSLDITDFLEITTHPVVSKALAEVPPTQAGMDSITKLLQSQISSNPDFKHNPLAIAIRTGIARMGQALQCLGPRGFITDVDSDIFREPVMASYISGIRSLYEALIESRSAAKSLMNSEKPLQDSEYFSRRQQLVCQNVKHLHMGDCGSTHYLLWHVRDERYEGVTKIGSSDLITIAGKYYLDEETNSLKIVRKSDKHLMGKTLKLRSVFGGCMHPDPHGVCEVCYGEAALAVPKNANLGHITCVSMTAILGQLILSTKHFDGSSKVEGIVLKPLEKKYLSSELNGNKFFLNEKLKGKEVKIHINTHDAPGLPDVKLVDNVDQLNVSRVSEFPMIGIEVYDGKITEITSLAVNVNDRRSSLSHDFLRYAKAHGYSVTDSGKYIFDMSKWDYSKPLLVLPMVHFSMSSHQSCLHRPAPLASNSY